MISYYEDNILLTIVSLFNLSCKPLALQLSIGIDLLSIGKYKFENNYLHTYYGKWGDGGCIGVRWGNDVGFFGV